MTVIQYIHCTKCNTDYLAGIDGKDISKTKTSGGKSFFAVGNEELKKAKKLSKSVLCKQCGTLCDVKNSTEKEMK